MTAAMPVIAAIFVAVILCWLVSVQSLSRQMEVGDETYLPERCVFPKIG